MCRRLIKVLVFGPWYSSRLLLIVVVVVLVSITILTFFDIIDGTKTRARGCACDT